MVPTTLSLSSPSNSKRSGWVPRMRKSSIAYRARSDQYIKNIYIPPKIIFDPSLILSPHVFLLGLLFADHTFDSVDGEEVLVLAKPAPSTADFE
jgi:hypothetical protein